MSRRISGRVTHTAALFAAVILVGCGGNNPTRRAGIDAGVQQQLRRDVAAVAAAAARHDIPAAQAALAALDADLAAAHTAGKLPAARLAQIRMAAAQVQTSLTRQADSRAVTPSPSSIIVTVPAGRSTPGKPAKSAKPPKTGKKSGKSGHGPGKHKGDD